LKVMAERILEVRKRIPSMCASVHRRDETFELEEQGRTSMADGAASTDWVAGADGFRDGWVVVCWQPASGTVRRRTVDTVEALFDLPESPAMMGIDMVIGCPERAEPGGRACDRAARQLLGHPRGASVFSTPAFNALWADTYEDALLRNRASGPDAPGLSKQTFHLFPKMRALAEQMTPQRQEWVREVHPELSFHAMNEDAPVEASKHNEAGRTTRMRLLETSGFLDIKDAVASLSSTGLGPDDVLDAHAACWTARRIHEGIAERCPPQADLAPKSAQGLRMEIWR
jgi:predicted RNase H-like nuclease